jgi:hypothetical protein
VRFRANGPLLWLSADADATPSALSTEWEAPELDMNQFQMPG